MGVWRIAVDANLVMMSHPGLKKCRVCQQRKGLDEFYKRKKRDGTQVHEDICKSCRTKQFLSKYTYVKEIIREIVAQEYSEDEQECEACSFLRECNYLVKVEKSMKSPYCFSDSPFHHRYMADHRHHLMLHSGTATQSVEGTVQISNNTC